MVRVDGGGRVDLQAVVVLAGILKEAVHGVEHLVGQEEEPLPGQEEVDSGEQTSAPGDATGGFAPAVGTAP